MGLGEASAVVERLRAKGVRLARVGERLSVAAPEGTLTPALAAEIRAHKADILKLLDGAIPKARRDGPLPLGVVQERMWAHAQMEPEALLYNLPAAWRFKGPFDARAFCAAFDDFVARHEVLRLRIAMADGLPLQNFAAPSSGALATEDLGALNAGARERELERRMAALRVCRFDLAAGPPFVARLFRLADDDHALFFMPHHLAWDGWCFDIFLRDLRELYLARTGRRAADLPDLQSQYADYALWHRRRVEEGSFAADLAYWEEALKAPPASPNLPADRTRPELFSAEGDWTDFPIETALLDKIKALAAGERATTFMAFLTFWRAFLARITGDLDIVIGAPIQARQHAEIADVVGCFVNTIFLRQKIDAGKSVRALLREARAVCLDAYQRQEAPVELLVDRLGARDPSRTPLAEVMFTHQHVARRPADFGAAALSQIHVNPKMSPTDLMFAVMEGREEARALLHYATGVFSSQQARCVARAFETFLRRAAEQPDTPIVAIALAEASAPAPGAGGDEPLLPAMIADAAARNPEKIAASSSASVLTYAQLIARSAALAGWLASKGVAAGDIVGLMTPRGGDTIALVLAVWRCGAAYLPLDPSYPAQRLTYMIEDSGAKLVVSASEIADIDTAAPRVDIDDAEGEIATSVAPAPRQGARAYVIYTSGSTGKPKGVENSHAALANFIRSMMNTPGVSAQDRLLAVTTLSFDISILELFAPLAAGAEVVIASAEEASDGEALLALVEKHRPTILQATPAAWRLLIDSGLKEAPTIKALCGGEALAPALADELLGRVGALWNMYGPTETTVWSTCKKIETADAIAIGGPIAKTSLYVVGFGETLMPDGVPGELWIGGEGVAIGYLKRPELTAEKFRADPFAGIGRIYRTGDLVRRRADGDIEHLGRIDAQVKLRGFRIELGEIEAALERHDAVARAIAAVKKDAAGEPVLAAYILYKDGASATGSELRRRLRETLPSFMLPQHFVEIAKIPLTGSGKIDRNALPGPAGAAPRRERTPPRSETEKAIAALWADILKAADISITDNFFELGGNSLQAAQMAARYRERTGARLAPRSVIFETLEQLAAGAESSSYTKLR